jgi:hypothetical protein
MEFTFNTFIFIVFLIALITVYITLSNSNAEFKTIINSMAIIFGLYAIIYIAMDKISYYKSLRPILTTPIIAANTGVRIRSNDFPTIIFGSGVKFSISMWMYVNNVNFNRDSKKNIFQKGKFKIYLEGNANDLCIDIPVYPVKSETNTYTMETLRFEDFPLQKWVNLSVVVDSRTVDLWLNGRLYQSIQLENLVYFNSLDDVYFVSDTQEPGTKGGYDGFISRVYYFDHALSRNEVNELFNRGPYANTFVTQFIERFIQLFSTEIPSVKDSSIKVSLTSKGSAEMGRESSSQSISDIVRNNESVLRLS